MTDDHVVHLQMRDHRSTCKRCSRPERSLIFRQEEHLL